VGGVPVMLGSNGIEKIIELDLTDEQKVLFEKSINSVKELTEVLENNFF
jgi:malate dehydrogenase